MQGHRGLLVVFEGAEGVGKSTQLARLAERLRARARTVRLLREPGGTPLGDEVRRILLDPRSDVDARTEALLFMASRAQLVAQVVRPTLATGTDVLLDRFFLSTYAYQVAGRGLPSAEVRAANTLATNGLVPDLTIVLTLPRGEGLRRAVSRGSTDRMERAEREFHDRVEDAFVRALDPEWQRAHPECGPVVAVDGRGSEAEVEERVWSRVVAAWPETFAAASVSDNE